MLSRQSERRRHLILTKTKDNRSLVHRPTSPQATPSTANNSFEASSVYIQTLKALSARDQATATARVAAEEDGDDIEQPETPRWSDIVFPKPSHSIEPRIQGVSQRHLSLTYTCKWNQPFLDDS